MDIYEFRNRFCNALDENDTNFRHVILKLTREYGIIQMMEWTVDAIAYKRLTGARNTIGGMVLKMIKIKITKVEWNALFNHHHV